jgi:transcriptional regulator with XRE-family HTH domain
MSSKTGLKKILVKEEHQIMENKTNMSVMLLDLRTKKGVTQEEAATSLGVSNKTISKWETGVSLPETEYLTGIADYYGVSVDELFGRETSRKDVGYLIMQQYKDLSKAQSVIKSFQMAHDVIISIHANWGKRNEIDCLNPKQIFGYPEYFNRSVFSSNEVFELLLNSKHANMAVMLAGNEDDFSWLTERADGYLPLLKFLSDIDALKLFQLMNSQKFPLEFTADFIAKAAELDENRAAEILDEAVKFEICSVNEMDLKDGLTKLYRSDGNGYILSALTLIYEWACGVPSHYNNHRYGEKLVRGDK